MAACGWLFLLPKTIGNVQSDTHVYCELYCKRSGIVSICMNLTNYEDHRKLLFIEESELISTQVMLGYVCHVESVSGASLFILHEKSCVLDLYQKCFGALLSSLELC